MMAPKHLTRNETAQLFRVSLRTVSRQEWA